MKLRLKTVFAVSLAASMGLGGCSLFDKSSRNEAATAQDGLRDAPGQDYAFGTDDGYTTTVYAGTPDYSGYDVVLYSPRSGLRQTAASYAPLSDPRDVGFVSLNGTSEPTDWRFCETVHRGYIFATENEFRLSPTFEVCMRNKGYVLSTEAGTYTSDVLTAATAGQSRAYVPSTSYSFP